MGIINKVMHLAAKRYLKTASELFIYHSDYVGALATVEKALAIEPNVPRAVVLYADVLFCLNREMEGLAVLDEFIEKQPYHAEAYVSRASILEALGQHRAALVDCEKALRLTKTVKQYLRPSIYEQKLALLIRLKSFRTANQVLLDAAEYLEVEEYEQLVFTHQRFLNNARISRENAKGLNAETMPQRMTLIKA
jgi:tetratricopeptide (TPR) repeat protein